MDSSDEPHTIRASFEIAEAKRKTLEATPDARSPLFAADLESTLALYLKAREQIAAVSLFSPNEGVEDIATTTLPYLLLDSHVANLIQRTPFTDMPQRAAVVRRARDAYESFLSLVDGYGLIDGPYKKSWELYRDGPEAFTVVVASDAAAKREAKVANFKAEKELRLKLETLQRNPRYLENGDEELVREVHLSSIRLAIHHAFQGLDSLNQEQAMIAQAPQAPPALRSGDADDTRRRQAEEEDTTWRLDQPLRQRIGGGGPLLSKKGKPLQPFTLVGSRSDLANGVFRPGHNLPTMSIDEYLEEEKRRGGILEGGTNPAKPQVDEDDMDAVDREMYKAREWDEFKDHNPRGSGNTMNMG